MICGGGEDYETGQVIFDESSHSYASQWCRREIDVDEMGDVDHSGWNTEHRTRREALGGQFARSFEGGIGLVKID